MVKYRYLFFSSNVSVTFQKAIAMHASIVSLRPPWTIRARILLLQSYCTLKCCRKLSFACHSFLPLHLQPSFHEFDFSLMHLSDLLRLFPHIFRSRRRQRVLVPVMNPTLDKFERSDKCALALTHIRRMWSCINPGVKRTVNESLFQNNDIRRDQF